MRRTPRLPAWTGSTGCSTTFRRNDWKRPVWGGPCPPIGRHRYFFRLHALNVVLSDLDKPARQRLQREMQGHLLGSAELMGTYQRR